MSRPVKILHLITNLGTGGAEVIPEGGGVLVDNPDDVSALEGALKTVVGDPARRAAMAQIARARYQDQAWDKICIAYYNTYRELAEKK